MTGKKQMMRKITKVATGLLLLLSVGCTQAPRTAPPPLSQRVAVLDFTVTDTIDEDDFQVEGWWLGAESIFQNPHAGNMFADALSRKLLPYDYIRQQSRTDIKYYMDSKYRLLTERFEQRSASEYREMLAQVSPLDYGDELGVDEVITGHVLEAYTSDHRTIHLWHSYVKVRVDVWSLAEGRKVWSDEFDEKNWFDSQVEAMDVLAEDVAEALDEDYFRRDPLPE